MLYGSMQICLTSMCHMEVRQSDPCCWGQRPFCPPAPGARACGSRGVNASNISPFCCKEQAYDRPAPKQWLSQGTKQGLAPSARERGESLSMSLRKSRVGTSAACCSYCSFFLLQLPQLCCFYQSGNTKLQRRCQCLHCMKIQLNLLLTLPPAS